MNRENFTIKQLLLIGFGCGLVSSLCGQTIMTRTDDYVQIAVVTGFTYIVLLCTFLGWRKERALAGAGIGMLVGAAYAALAHYGQASIGERFFGGMINNFIVYPCVLSGVLAGALASYKGPQLKEASMRFFKGAFSGLVLGGAHFAFVLMLISSPFNNIFGAINTLPMVSVALALGFASAIYFPLISSAIGFTTQPGPITRWFSKVTMWRAGLALFVLMTVLGALWSWFR